MKIIHINAAPGGRALDAAWRKDPNYAYLGRPGKGLKGPYGNPHPVGFPCPRCRGLDGKLLVHKHGEAIAAFENTLEQWDRELLKRKLRPLFNVEFGVCFCAPKPCHGDVIARWVEMFKKEDEIDKADERKKFDDSEVRSKTYYCVVCKTNMVSPADGEDTCPNCLKEV